MNQFLKCLHHTVKLLLPFLLLQQQLDMILILNLILFHQEMKFCNLQLLHHLHFLVHLHHYLLHHLLLLLENQKLLQNLLFHLSMSPIYVPETVLSTATIHLPCLILL
jgi:hypothetical protein